MYVNVKALLTFSYAYAVAVLIQILKINQIPLNKIH